MSEAERYHATFAAVVLPSTGFAERAPAGATFNNFTAALGLIGPVNMAVNGPTLRGAIFMPTDEAFASFFGSVDGGWMTACNKF